MPRRDVADALSEAVRTINKPVSLDETLQTIVHTAKETVPGIDHAGISVALRSGKLITRAATDDLVLRLDELQYEVNSGPCVYAMRGHGVVVVEHAERELRWPAFMPRAVEMGLRAQLGVQLFTDEASLGGLNLYSTRARTFDSEAPRIAELFAAHAAVAFRRAQTEHDLNRAVKARQLVGQAVGILMERYQLSEDRAFGFLTRTSQSSNVKLREIAQELVDVANERGTIDSLPQPSATGEESPTR